MGYSNLRKKSYYVNITANPPWEGWTRLQKVAHNDLYDAAGVGCVSTPSPDRNSPVL
jgi:hypothetical protein